MSDRQSDDLFRRGKYEEASNRLKKGLEKEGEDGRDSLLYLLDIGLSLHTAGKYEESNEVLLKAEKIADIKDYTSISRESATLLTSDNIKDYKGEDFEKILVNTYLAMNFALMGNYEDALVEARKVNHKLYLMVTEGQRKYKQNAFARYLSAVIYESEGEYNDAYIDLQKTFELEPGYPGLGKDLWRLAYLLDMPDGMEKWKERYELTKSDIQEQKDFVRAIRKKQKSEIVVIYENGISPVKKPHPNFHSVPKFYPRFNPVRSAQIEINGREVAQTAVLHDVESTAIGNLDDKYSAIIARKVAGAAIKEGIAYGVGRQTNSLALWMITRALLYAQDQADVRSWNLLPRDLQMARIAVEPGTYTVAARPNGGTAVDYLPLEKTVQVEPGKRIFVNFRYMPY